MALTDHNSKQFEENIIRLQLRTTCTKLSLDAEPNKESEQRLIVAEQGGHVYLEQLEYLDEDEPVRDHYTIHHLPADAIHSVFEKVKHDLPMLLQTEDSQVYTASEIETLINESYQKDKEKESKEYQRKAMTPSLRYDIMKRDGFKCVLCGRTPKDGITLHVDHILPVSKGGKTVPSNLRTLCSICNLGKSDKYDENGLN